MCPGWLRYVYLFLGGDGNKSTNESLDVEDDKTTDEEAGDDEEDGEKITMPNPYI